MSTTLQAEIERARQQLENRRLLLTRATTEQEAARCQRNFDEAHKRLEAMEREAAGLEFSAGE